MKDEKQKKKIFLFFLVFTLKTLIIFWCLFVCLFLQRNDKTKREKKTQKFHHGIMKKKSSSSLSSHHLWIRENRTNKNSFVYLFMCFVYYEENIFFFFCLLSYNQSACGFHYINCHIRLVFEWLRTTTTTTTTLMKELLSIN